MAAVMDGPGRRRLLPAVLAGGTAGLAGGLFGVGGGIILVPTLTGPFKLTQHQAHGTSIAIVGATALVSLAVYAAHGNVAWLPAVVVGIASAVSARWGARWATRTAPDRLAQAFAVFLLLVAVRLLWRTESAGGPVLAIHAAGVALEAAIGLAVGLLAGYMGVGGGIIAVPAFTLMLGMSQQIAQGTSLAVILVTAPAGALEHHRHGNVVTALIPPFALGAAIGGPLASLLAQHLPQAVLVRTFAVFVIVNAVHIGWRAERSRRLRLHAP